MSQFGALPTTIQIQRARLKSEFWCILSLKKTHQVIVFVCLEIPCHIGLVRLVHVSGVGVEASAPLSPLVFASALGERTCPMFIIPLHVCVLLPQHKIRLIELQGLPQTFEQAFAGHRSVLVNRMDLSHGLLEQLHDENLINRQHYLAIKVSIHSLF